MKKRFPWWAVLIAVLATACIALAVEPVVHVQNLPPAGSSNGPQRREVMSMQMTVSETAAKCKQQIENLVAQQKTAGEAQAELEAKASALRQDQEAGEGQTPIMGSSTATADQMARLFAATASYPAKELKKGGAPGITDLCKIIAEEAQAEGVRAEVVFAQAMVETGWLSFNGSDSISQFNFAGLGTVGDGKPGNAFPDVRTGIRAQVQHLKAYASTDPINRKLVDKRFDQVQRGSAPYVEWLGMQENPTGAGWAAGADYGKKILKIMNDIQSQ